MVEAMPRQQHQSRSRTAKLLLRSKKDLAGPTRHQIVNVPVEVGDAITVGFHSSVPAGTGTVPPGRYRDRSVTSKQLAKATSP